MKKTFKTGLLIILLAVPVFLFLFLSFFGENEFDLPYLFGVSDSEVKAQDLLNDVIEVDNARSVFVFNRIVGSDSLYIGYDTEMLNQLIYYFPEQDMPENHKLELARFKSVIKNQGKFSMLFLNKSNLNDYWFYLLKFMKYKYPEVDSEKGVLFLIDENGFFRGCYQAKLKSETDRLITEYQIIEHNM